MQIGSDMTQTLERLRTVRRVKGIEARRDVIEAPPRVRRRAEDITINGLVHRRKKCRHCKYQFQYLMRGTVCPECGNLRDDYPMPSLSIAAFGIAIGVGGALSALGVLAMYLAAH
jgi:predicted Zn-ribbon and HTH transcriptional regulator